MGKTKGSFEEKELAGKGWFPKAMAAKFGKVGIKALEDGVWCIAEAFKGRELTTGMERNEAIEELILLMDEAARKCDGTRLRLLAEAIEARKHCSVHDPLRAWILGMVSNRILALGLEIPAVRPPQTAEGIQNSIRRFYPPGEVPTLNTIRVEARKHGVPLVRKKPGAPPGATFVFEGAAATQAQLDQLEACCDSDGASESTKRAIRFLSRMGYFNGAHSLKENEALLVNCGVAVFHLPDKKPLLSGA